METAYRMQHEATDVFDIRKEPESIRDRIRQNHVRERLHAGAPPGGTRRPLRPYLLRQPANLGTTIKTSARTCASGVRIWTSASAALIRDLKRRGLLDETLVVWGGEFGRTPVSENGEGRDHNPYGFTMFVAGGGVKGGTWLMARPTSSASRP